MASSERKLKRVESRFRALETYLRCPEPNVHAPGEILDTWAIALKSATTKIAGDVAREVCSSGKFNLEI